MDVHVVLGVRVSEGSLGCKNKRESSLVSVMLFRPRVLVLAVGDLIIIENSPRKFCGHERQGIHDCRVRRDREQGPFVSSPPSFRVCIYIQRKFRM